MCHVVVNIQQKGRGAYTPTSPGVSGLPLVVYDFKPSLHGDIVSAALVVSHAGDLNGERSICRHAVRCRDCLGGARGWDPPCCRCERHTDEQPPDGACVKAMRRRLPAIRDMLVGMIPHTTHPATPCTDHPTQYPGRRHQGAGRERAKALPQGRRTCIWRIPRLRHGVSSLIQTLDLLAQFIGLLLHTADGGLSALPHLYDVVDATRHDKRGALMHGCAVSAVC